MSKITLATLPEWRAILKSIFIKPPRDKELATPWLFRDSDIPYWFSCSTIIMSVISQWWEAYTDKKLPTIWIPDYFCNQSLQFLREANIPLHFYPITNQFLPDWEKCREQSLTIAPDIFILVHYFGYPADGKLAGQFCHEHECILVEDAAHVLVPQRDIGLHGEFAFYSPHKLLSIPDGAVLIQRPKTKVLRKLSNKDPVEVMSQIIANMPQESPTTWLWLLKRILQKFLPDFLWLRQSRTEYLADIPHIPIPFKPLQSRLSVRLLASQILHINEYALTRQTNQAIFRGCHNSSEENVLFPSSDYIPYMTGVRYNTKTYAEKHFRLLNKNRAPVMKWPDLPPEVISDSGNHTIAIELENTMLFFPVHQSLTILSIKRILRLGGNKLSEVLDNNEYEIEWYKGKKEEWSDWIAKVGIPNLMQSWEYGEVKKSIENWKVKRGMIKRNNQVVATFQALEKSWGPIGIVRINRGPLLINGIDNFETKYNIYKTLRNSWMWWKGKGLLIAPELVAIPENLGVLELAYFRKRPAKPWGSSLIDLSLTESDIRKNLNGKWRNQLKKSESSGVEIINDNSDNSFEELLGHYKQMMRDKSFKGPSIELYTDLHSRNKNNLYVFQAWLDGQAVAGILIVRHGASCTYQIGWNSPTGRKVYANNLLLWNAVLEMKQHNCFWFDMGGIDENTTPGIVKFKRGLGGKEYALVGEWR